MKFIKSKSKKSGLSDAWRQAHVTIVDFTGFKVETEGKPAVPEDIAWRINGIEVVKALMKSWGIDRDRYRIVFHLENPQFGPLIDEFEELFEKHPECRGLEGINELVCLEEKTGKKYVLVLFDLGVFTIAEIL
jgi:hypothetical protein